MNVKNTQLFRATWRKEQGYSMENWDENFIGSNANDKSGFYKMVNGIVDNIKADLTPKLQNAQDEQAMYEFLQNAADSQSTQSAIIYDEQYFMVLNNGNPFTEKDLKALLNSFQGTKADKTKAENCGKIGRYGIGFKLAYRLLGKSDGADELVRDLAGPLLFSWHNTEQLNALLAYQIGGELASHDNLQGTDAAWLLKIILACFPTAMGEEVKNLDYKNQVLFQPQELEEMVAFLQKHKKALEGLSLERGSMFFLKFGPKKYEKLKESLINIKSGIGYAMNTLKTLQKVTLQDETIERYPVKMENFSILPESEEFKLIDPEFPFCPIDISLGFLENTEQAIALKSAPSIYQFFPMRNERHSLAFFIHSTSFAKITDRTRLDDQGEANIETFKYIAATLKKKLNKYKTDNFEKYTLIYKGILLSDKSKEYDAKLLNTHLYEPLLQYIQANIPTRKNNVFAKDLVIIKGTNLPVEPMQWGVGKEWFYWAKPEDEIIQKDAANNAKLGLRMWTLRDLILEGTTDLINAWIEELEDEDYTLFMQELAQIRLDNTFSNKFKDIKCFKFKDNKNKTNFYAIDDLKQAENVFLISEKTASIAPAIKALGFSVLQFTVGEYADILKQLFSQLDYLTNEKALFTKIINSLTKSTLNPEKGTLHTKDKHSLLSFFKELKSIKEEEIRQVPLYSNRYGQASKFSALLSTDAEVPVWLENFKIKLEEDTGNLQNLLINKNTWEIYSYIIQPNWENLISLVNVISSEVFENKKYQRTNIPDVATLARTDEPVLLENQLLNIQNAFSSTIIPEFLKLYEYTITHYAKKVGQPKLGNVPTVFVDETHGFQEAGKILYKKSLESVSSEAYKVLKSAVWKAFSLHLPAQEILPFLAQEPFKLADFTADKDWKTRLQTYIQTAQNIKLSSEERQALFAILYNALSIKEVTLVPVFEGKEGHILPIGQLIRAEAEVPEAWFEAYKMKPTESQLFPQMGVMISLSKEDLFNEKTIHSKENSLLISEDLIYNFIVLADWQNLTAQKSVGKAVGKFYESVVRYAQIGKSTKPLINLPYIFVDEKTGFVNPNQVFYHAGLSHENDYGQVSKVLLKLTNLSVPHAETLPFLQEPVFKTKDNSFAQSLLKEESFIANKEEIIALQKFLDQTNENFFEIFVVEESENNAKEFILHKKNNKITACYLDKNQQKIAEKIKEVYSEQYKTLPAKLYLPELRNKGLLQGAPLFDLLSKAKDLPADMLTTMLAESGNAEMQQKVFNKIDKIVLKQGVLYEKASFEHQALQIFRNKEADFGAFRAKIFVENNEGIQTPLNTIAFEPTVNFSLEKVGKFSLQLAEILPAFAENQAFLEQILAQIQDYEAPNSLKKRCFEYEERAGKLVFADLKRDFLQLENASQLAFLLFYVKANNQEKTLSEFQVLNQAGEWIALSAFEIWHTKGTGFINSNAILSQKKYAGLAEILHLNEKRGAFEVGNQRVVIEPYFEKEVFYASPLTPEEGMQGTLPLRARELLDFAYQKWTALEDNARPNAITLYGVQMNFEFQELVYPFDYASDAEEKAFPEWLNEWIEDGFSEEDLEERTALNLPATAEEGDENLPTQNASVADKLGFLQALGVHFNDTVVLMRHFLSGAEGLPITQKQINELRQNQTILKNTLDWVADNEMTIVSTEAILALIRKIYNALDNVQDLPAPYIVSMNKGSFSYNLGNFYEEQLYYFDIKQQAVLLEKYNVSIEKILSKLIDRQLFLTNLELKGIEPKTTKIEEILNIATLQKNSQEWGASHYLKWREEVPYRVYLYAGEMPYQLRFCDTDITTFKRDNVVLCEEIVYVNKNAANIEEELFKITKSATLTEHFVLQLLRYKNETAKETAHTIIERVVEQIVITDVVGEDEELIENPDIQAIINAKNEHKGTLKLTIDLEGLPTELLEEIMQYAQKSKMIVKK